MKRRGFTLIELLVVVAIIALLIAILLPSLGKAKELSNRSVCAANVRGIMQSMVVYTADNADNYPYLGPTDTASANKNPVGQHTGGLMNDIYFLVGSGSVAPKQFVCKSDNYATPAQSAQSIQTLPGYDPPYWKTGNAFSEYCYSYSFAFQYFSNNSLATYWRNSMDAGCPIAADMNPGSVVAFPKTALHNSHTHNDEGQNVGYADAHAEFTRTPLAGEGGDNIYSVGSKSADTSTGGTPQVPSAGNTQGSFDTCLVPGIQNDKYARF